MTPQEFLRIVVQPNCADASGNPRDLRAAANAIFALDAIIGIAYWHLYDLGHPSATKHNGDDSPYKNELAQHSHEYQVIKDSAFALKHGRLTRNKKVPPLVKDASQVEAEVHTLSSTFKLNGSLFGGEHVYIDLDSGKVEAAPVIAATLAFIETYVANLP